MGKGKRKKNSKSVGAALEEPIVGLPVITEESMPDDSAALPMMAGQNAI